MRALLATRNLGPYDRPQCSPAEASWLGARGTRHDHQEVDKL